MFGKFRLKRWLKKGNRRIFDYEIPIFALSYGLSEGEVRHIIATMGYWSLRYSDELCHFSYYINDDSKRMIPASMFAKDGKITITNCYFHGVDME